MNAEADFAMFEGTGEDVVLGKRVKTFVPAQQPSSLR